MPQCSANWRIDMDEWVVISSSVTDSHTSILATFPNYVSNPLKSKSFIWKKINWLYIPRSLIWVSNIDSQYSFLLGSSSCFWRHFSENFVQGKKFHVKFHVIVIFWLILRTQRAINFNGLFFVFEWECIPISFSLGFDFSQISCSKLMPK